MDYSKLPVFAEAEIVVCGGGTAGAFAAKQLGLTKKQIIPFKLSGSQEISRILAVYEKTSATPAKYPRNQARQKPLGMKK